VAALISILAAKLDWRQKLHDRWLRRNLAAVGPQHEIARAVRFESPAKIAIGSNVQICPGAVLDGRSGSEIGIKIADGVHIKEYAYIDAYGGYVELGERVRVGHHTVLAGHGGLVFEEDSGISGHGYVVSADHDFGDITRPILEQGETRRGIKVRERAWIGCNVSVLDGVEIGIHCVIGAGSVVRDSIPDFHVAVGVPARVIKCLK